MTDPSVLVVGDTLVDFIPDSDATPSAATEFSTNFGGACANVAMVLETLGVPPFFWTRIARDDFGDFLATHLAASEVRDDYVVRDADAKTTLGFVTHDEQGESSFDFFRERPADGRMAAGTVRDETLRDVDWVHFSTVTLCREPSRSATLELVERARRHDCTVSFDPNTRPELWHSDHEYEVVVRGTLEKVDVVKGGPDDVGAAGFDTNQSPAAIARDVAAAGPHTVFLTLGSDGALCYGTEESPFEGVTRHPGYDVTPMDTTGAGDAFLAGVVGSMTNGVTDPGRVLEVANALGAVVTTEPGSLTALAEAKAIRTHCGPLPWE